MSVFAAGFHLIPKRGTIIGLKSPPNPDLQMRLDMFCRTVVASKGVKESRVEILFCNRAAEQQGF